jgi:hypothetical protein
MNTLKTLYDESDITESHSGYARLRVRALKAQTGRLLEDCFYFVEVTIHINTNTERKDAHEVDTLYNIHTDAQAIRQTIYRYDQELAHLEAYLDEIDPPREEQCERCGAAGAPYIMGEKNQAASRFILCETCFEALTNSDEPLPIRPALKTDQFDDIPF